jgi:hypothetical protein
MAGLDFEFLIRKNVPQLGEVATWVETWNELKDEPGVTFRSHAKGVTDFDKHQTVTLSASICNVLGTVTAKTETRDISWSPVPARPTRAVAMRRWTEILYHTLLDFWPTVEALLATYPIAGSFKKHDAPSLYQPWPDWHYSGSFFWVRNRDFFARKWRTTDQGFYGTETWPGFNFRREQAGCVFYNAMESVLEMDDPDYIAAKIEPALLAWESNNAR